MALLGGGLVALGALWVGAPAAFAAAPVVSSFSPASGTIGTQVTVTGSNFAGATVVSFGGGHASFTVASSTSITATVPASAATGKISVTTPSGTGSSSSSFNVTAGVASSPATGPPTTAVTFSGVGFGARKGIDVYFDATEETIASTNATGNFSATFAVPASATPGAHEITAVEPDTDLSAQASFTVATSWPQFHYSDRHKGRNPFENVLSTANVSAIDEDWTFATGNAIDSSPAVVNGVVYVGSEDDKVYALNASTGAKLWSFTTASQVESSPAVVGGVLYVGSDDHKVYALNASTGAKLWSFTTGGSVYSSPSVVNGVVYVGSEDDKVYALDASTGAKLWSVKTGGQVDSSPAVTNGLVYVGSEDHNVYALNASTGAKFWKFTASGGIHSSPAVANGVVYVGGEGDHVDALNASTGLELWSFATGAAVDSSPAVANGVVYVGDESGDFYALNASTGAELWSFTTGGPVYSSPAVANGVVYVGSEGSITGGTLNALNASTGAELWSFTAASLIDSSPAVANGVVYVGSKGDNLDAFDLAGGTESMVVGRWHTMPRSTTVRELTVERVPSGGSVTISCSGNGCPFAHETVKNLRDAALAGLFGGARLRPGTRIRVTIDAPHLRDRVLVFVIRLDQRPLELRGCSAFQKAETLRCA